MLSKVLEFFSNNIFVFVKGVGIAIRELRAISEEIKHVFRHTLDDIEVVRNVITDSLDQAFAANKPHRIITNGTETSFWKSSLIDSMKTANTLIFC